MSDTDEPKAADAIAAEEPGAAVEPSPDAKTHVTPRAASTATLINRMLAIMSRRLEIMMENPMEAGDKEIQLLGSMSRSLEQLIELKKAQTKARPKAQTRTPKELAELRRKIADRIEQLNNG